MTKTEEQNFANATTTSFNLCLTGHVSWSDASLFRISGICDAGLHSFKTVEANPEHSCQPERSTHLTSVFIDLLTIKQSDASTFVPTFQHKVVIPRLCRKILRPHHMHSVH